MLIRRDRSAPVVAIVTYVSAGYFDETDDVVGIAHVLEHMYFKGTPTRGVGEIAKQTKAVGGYLNAGDDLRSHELLHGAAVVGLRRRGSTCSPTRTRDSLIDADELARELEVIIQEAKRKADNPARRRDRDAVRAAARPASHPPLAHRARAGPARAHARRDASASIATSIIRATRCSRSSATSIPTTRCARSTRATARCRRASRRARPGRPKKALPASAIARWTGDIGQTQLAFGWRTPGTDASRHAGARPARRRCSAAGARRASIAPCASGGSRRRCRAYNYTPTELGVFVVHAETPPRSTRRCGARDRGRSSARVRDGDIGEREIERAKRIYESRWIRRLEDMEGQANYLAEWEALGDWRMGDGISSGCSTTTRDDLAARREPLSRSRTTPA